jgi:hypothetical protein
MDDNSKSNASGGPPAHLTLGLRKRFPEPQVVDGKEVKPYRTDNFIVHQLRTTSGKPWRIYQALPRLLRQPGLIEILRRNSTLPHDTMLHQSLEFLDSEMPEEPFYILETMDGDLLSDVIERQDLAIETIYQYVRDLLKAIEPFHEKGLVVGSLDMDQLRLLVGNQTYQNLRLGGLYRVHKPDESLRLNFNPEFNAPPPPEDEPLRTAQDDVYVVGMIAYRLLLGKSLYNETFKHVLSANEGARAAAWETRHREGGIGPMPSRRDPDYAHGIDGWFKRALARDRKGRYDDAQKAVEALDQAWKAYQDKVNAGPFEPGGGYSRRDPVVIQPPRTVPWPVYLLGGAAALSAVLVAVYLFLQPSSALMAQIDAKRTEIEAVLDEAHGKSEKLNKDGDAYRGVRAAIDDYRQVTKDYPPSRSTAQPLLDRYVEVKAEAEGALRRVDDLITQVTDNQQTYAQLVASLTQLVTAEDQRLKDASTRANSIDDLVKKGDMDAALAQYADAVAAMKVRVDALSGARDKAQTSQKAVAAIDQKLASSGILGLTEDFQLAKNFRQFRDMSAHAKGLIDARDWASAESTYLEAQALGGKITAAHAKLKEEVQASLGAATDQLGRLAAVSPEADPTTAGFSGRLAAIQNAVNDNAHDAASRDLAGLTTELGQVLVKRQELSNSASALTTELSTSLAGLRQLVPANHALLADAGSTLDRTETDVKAKRFEDAIGVIKAILPEIAKVVTVEGEQRQQAIKGKQAYDDAKPKDVIAAVNLLGKDHEFHRGATEIAETVSAAEGAIKERQWRDAIVKHDSALVKLKALASSMKTLVDRVSERRTKLGSQIEELSAAGGQNPADLDTLKTGLAQAQQLATSGRYDLADARFTTLISQADNLLSRVPVDRELLDEARKELEDVRAEVSSIATNLLPGSQLRRGWDELERAYKAVNASAKSTSFGALAKTIRELTGKYETLLNGIDELRDRADAATASLDATLKEAREKLPEKSADLAAAATALDAATKDLEAQKLDTAESAALAAQKVLEAKLKVAATEQQAAANLLAKYEGQLQSLQETYGDWISRLEEAAKVNAALSEFHDRQRVRNYKAASGLAGDLDVLFSELNKAVSKKGAQMAEAKVSALAAKAAAEEAKGTDTEAFRTAETQMKAGDAAAEAKQYVEGAEAYLNGKSAFSSVKAEQIANAEEVAKLRMTLASGIERARSLLPASHTIIAEVQEALNLGSNAGEDGTLTRLTLFRTLATRMDSANEEADAAWEEVTARLDALPAKLTEIEKAGGHTSSRYPGIKTDIEAAQAAKEKHEWGQARVALLRAETDLAAIEDDIAKGLILACPDSNTDNGTRIVPAATYSIGGNTTAARIAADARSEAKINKDESIVLPMASPFCITMQQVTVEEFAAYIDDGGQVNESREQLIQELDPSEKDSVVYVSQTDAEGYAAWLSAKTGRSYGLPTLDQSLAAVSMSTYSDAEIPEIANGIGDEKREWTRESCDDGNGFVVVGRTGKDDFKRYAQCLSKDEMNSLVGFRLVVLQK